MLEDKQLQQQDMFNTNVNKPELMQCYDNTNHRYGNSTIEVAAAGRADKWKMRHSYLSPSYTSKWRDITKIEY